MINNYGKQRKTQGRANFEGFKNQQKRNAWKGCSSKIAHFKSKC